MPKTRGKYDHPAFVKTFSRNFRVERNFYYFLEDLARKKPTFKHKLSQIVRERQRRHISEDEAEKQIWREVQATIRPKKQPI